MARSILLADDSATIRRVVELTFSDTPIHVQAVSSGSEALAKLRVFQPDMVLADVVMPEPSGYEICRRIKNSDRPVPVLLLAGTFEKFDPDMARECGADGCLMKPFESRTLLERVESLLDGRATAAAAPLEVFGEAEDDATADVAVETAEPAAPVPESQSGGAVKVHVEPDPAPAASTVQTEAALPRAEIEAISREVVRHLSEDVVRRIAREVVPQVARELVRERIRELEDEDS